MAVQGLAFVILDRYLMPRFNLAAFFVFAALLLSGNRRWSRALARRRQGAPMVVLVGDVESIALARDHLLLHFDRDAQVVASVTDISELVGAIDESDATDVLLLDVAAFEKIYPDPLNQLERTGIGFLQRVSARETLLGLRSVRQVGGMPFVPLRTHTVPTHKLVQKRLFDLPSGARSSADCGYQRWAGCGSMCGFAPAERLLPPGARWPRRCDVLVPEVPNHGERRREARSPTRCPRR